MTKGILFSKGLDGSNGTVKNGQNDKMQTSDQPPKTPWFLRLPEAILRQIGLAVLAVGVDAAASFLKSTMEKTAAVASQVGAAVLKSKKAISAAASAVLVRIRPEPSKKTRLASASILALLAGIFIAQNQGMATPRGVWLSAYEEHYYNRLRKTALDLPVVGRVAVPTIEPWSHRTSLWSTYYPPINIPNTFTYFVGSVTEATYSLFGWRQDSYKTTTHISGGLKLTSRTYRNAAGKQVTVADPNHLSLVYHQKVGDKTSIWISGWANSLQNKTIEKWRNKVFFHKTQTMEGGSFEFSVHFGARNDFIPSDDLNCTGYCEAGRISAYPGPSTLISPCVPSNMSMPSNGYLEFHYWDQLVPASDDDNE